ncbi:hypothetical protein CAPTEDRAFT_222842 [Capitella teleta]|uniref:RGS domain-containing protein n=1 Tax=Capitella teleta TaxID=283909 RepID=R7T344_CAPTE|nr:hypothetical protein CAPTEDRAFT_222842 [Capitella teleta]|eukprot:ELT87067.1 hypothetical protein CAPTEDRAFT_222842 [Capitella teleta]
MSVSLTSVTSQYFSWLLDPPIQLKLNFPGKHTSERSHEGAVTKAQPRRRSLLNRAQISIIVQSDKTASTLSPNSPKVKERLSPRVPNLHADLPNGHPGSMLFVESTFPGDEDPGQLLTTDPLDDGDEATFDLRDLGACSPPPAKAKRPRVLVLKPAADDDVSDPLRAQTPLLTSSRLSKTLHEVLHDRDALPYLLQFLASKGNAHLLQFWLDVQSFQAASQSRLQSGRGLGQAYDKGGGGEVVRPRDLPLRHSHRAKLNTADPAPGANPHSNTPPPAPPEVSTQRPNADVKEKLKQSIESDAVTIFSKYISKDCTHSIEVSDDLRDEVIKGICREDGEVDPRCFARCQEHVVSVIDKKFYSDFLSSEAHCQHQVDILTSTQVSLADVLYNESALFYFMEFMEQEGAMPLLQCWLDLDSFQQHLGSAPYDGMQAQSDAMVLYEKFFSMQATQPLGFDDSVRLQLENNICREGGPLPDCFQLAKSNVLRTMDKIYFSSFLQSPIYIKFLNDLISTVQAQDIPSHTPRRPRRGSECSSEHSVGSQSSDAVSIKNTLLAGALEPANPIVQKALNRIEDDMRIDTALFNPDQLWKRNHSGKMSLGKINEVGQFVSELAPEPDHEKKKKGVFQKLMRGNDRQTQEEMALQIAQLILKDVSDSTQYADPGLAS